MTLRARLALSAALAVAAAVVLASIAVYFVVRAELRGELDDSLRERAASIQAARGPRFGGPVPRIPAPLLGGAAGYVQVVDAQGGAFRPGGAETPLPVDDRTLRVAAGDEDGFFSDAEVAGVPVRIITVPYRSGLAVQVARPLSEVSDVLGRLRGILLGVGLAGAALAALLGLGVAKAALAPARRLTDTAEEIAATHDLSRRVDAQRPDELGRLGAAFNAMLAALERSLESQRRLVADASHELRTPLTSLRTNVALLERAGELTDAERRRLLADVDSELAELSRLVADVVDLARDGEPEHRLEELRLDELVADSVERARRRAPGITFETSFASTIVRGSPERLHRAVTNVIDNAVKWSPAGGVVEIRVAEGAVAVRDHGPGIADEDLPHVFDRFYRSRAARGLPGSGLGLAIVRQVAEAHGGRVSAERAEGGGTIVRLQLTPLP